MTFWWLFCLTLAGNDTWQWTNLANWNVELSILWKSNRFYYLRTPIYYHDCTILYLDIDVKWYDGVILNNLVFSNAFFICASGPFYEEGSSARSTDPPLSWIRTRVKSLYPTLYSYAFYSSKKKIQREYYLNNEIEKKLKTRKGLPLERLVK